MVGGPSRNVLVGAVAVGIAAAVLAGALWQKDSAEAASYEFLLIDPKTKGPVRYNPCSPIRYVINPDGAPEGGIDDVKDAVAQIADATEIEFVFDGLVDERLGSARRIYQPETYDRKNWAPLLIGWVPEDELVRKGRHAAGAGGSAYETNGEGSWVFVSGLITLNGDIELEGGFDEGRTWGDVALHELGHVVGLDHVADPEQIMFESITEFSARLGDGDLEGLRKLGRGAGCVTEVTPEELTSPFGDPFAGERLSLTVYDLALRNDDCDVVAFKALGIGEPSGAYFTNCRSWGTRSVYIFYLSLGNKTKHSVGYRVRGFVMTTRNGATYPAINVRKLAEHPAQYISLAGVIPRSKYARGYVAFLAPPGVVPKFVSYADGEDLLTIRFDGKPEVYPRS